ncbi:MAG: hypothetical protein DCC88_07320 [Spirobacillus cienkowskii]|jgi:hypothetical protein|uniref:Uncharacterized protein n=1 Tax=Spirobacillus cienkowskii TaxID=495820 RepID=A0A369KRK0_9BACT|nr:MAG: hypothetical protein DCC88_07320 [Spirobacillus cienkowskii]
MLKIKKLLYVFSTAYVPIANGISIYDKQIMDNNSNTHYRSNDQGSISNERWDNFLKINKSYEEHKKNLENILNNFENHVDLLYFKAVRDLIIKYHTSLIVLEKYDPNSFNKMFPNQTSEEIYNRSMQDIEPLFLQIINKSFYQYLKYFFANNSEFLKEIEFNFWVKAYWPTLNTQHFSGFESAHYLKNSSKKILEYSIFNDFLLKSNVEDFDFMQNEVTFGEFWNSASLTPWVTNSKNPVYYKFIYNKNIDLIKKYLLPDLSIYEKEIENFSVKIGRSNLVLNIINFKTKIFETFLNLNLRLNLTNKKYKSDNFDNKRKFDVSNYLLNTYKIFDKNKCLSKVKSRHAKYENCAVLDNSQEWLIYPINKNFTEFKIYSVKENVKCLEDKLGNTLLISKCINNNRSQIWKYSKDSKNRKIIRNLESNKILGSTNHVTTKITREMLLLASVLSNYKLYSESDWEDGIVISKDIPYILYLAMYLNKYEIPNSSIEFLKLVNSKSWSRYISPSVLVLINKLINNPKFFVENVLLLNLFNEISNKKMLISKMEDYTRPGDFYFFDNNNTKEKDIFISRFYGNLKINMLEIPKNKSSNENFIYFASCPEYFSDDLVLSYIKFIYSLKYQDLLSKILFVNNEYESSVFKNFIINEDYLLNSSFLMLNKMNGYDENYNEINSILKLPNIYNSSNIIIDPIYENLPYQRIENSMYRFFQLVEDNDGFLLNHNDFRVPTYREVWNRWLQQEWNPPQEFEQIQQQIQTEIEGSSQELFDRLFDDFQNYWIEQLLNRYERQEQGIQVSGNPSEVSSGYDDAYPVSIRSDDSGMSSNASQEFMPVDEVEHNAQILEDMEIVEEANNIETLFEVANVNLVSLESGIQALNELIIAENSVSTVTLSTVIPIVIVP